MYVPSATALTSGGYFVPRGPSTATGEMSDAAFPGGAQAGGTSSTTHVSSSIADTTYDTIFSAQHILLGMQQVSHLFVCCCVKI
jgi:hypothetical protein